MTTPTPIDVKQSLGDALFQSNDNDDVDELLLATARKDLEVEDAVASTTVLQSLSVTRTVPSSQRPAVVKQSSIDGLFKTNNFDVDDIHLASTFITSK
ncbi:unnamed protein product [Mesocestoides corti]|uniref:Uncharacterized protein n=1 Tax=Mesocestoides corti TaxID=53468 RepID=A0A0R3UMM7_MESCO|nr:unnamed protein product [Mesocestoides corti]